MPHNRRGALERHRIAARLEVPLAPLELHAVDILADVFVNARVSANHFDELKDRQFGWVFVHGLNQWERQESNLHGTEGSAARPAAFFVIRCVCQFRHSPIKFTA